MVARRSSLLTVLFALALLLFQPGAAAFGAEASGVYDVAPGQSQPGPAVKQAFDLLMDRFVIPPNPADILNGGWQGGLEALKSKGVQSLPDAPSFGPDREADWRMFRSAYGRLAAAAQGKLETSLLDQFILDGMARSLNEGHTYYMTPEEFRRAQAQMLNRDRYAGIGVRINEDRKIIEVFEGSPAAAGGIKPGDQIIAVNGEPVEGMTPANLGMKIRGEEGTAVELTVDRDGQQLVFKLVRAQVQISWLAHRVLDGGVGYLLIRTFPVPSALDEFRAAIHRFEEAGVKGLIIDLRGNGGGSVDTGLEIASTFIKQGPIFRQIDRRGGQRTVTAFGDYWEREIPIAMLVDGGSGSMSEIFAAAMQERGEARLFGTKTAGNVAGTTYHPLVDGSGLAVTNLIITSGEGRTLNGVGLEPNEVVELDPKSLSTGTDNQLSAALAYVRAEAEARQASSVPRASARSSQLDAAPVSNAA